MRTISKAILQALKEQYPKGTRVELIHMDDPYNTKLVPGCKGTVISVDSIGTIHVVWDCGSGLGVANGADECREIAE